MNLSQETIAPSKKENGSAPGPSVGSGPSEFRISELHKHPVRCGILGVGGFANFRRRKLRQSGVFQLAACVEPDEGNFLKAQKEEAALRRYRSAEEMAADPTIEAVFIATPASLHTSQAWPMVQAGKAIFIEKPLGHDLEECRRLVEFCEAESIAHGHGFSTPYKPLWIEVKRIIESGELGEIVSVSAVSMHTGGLSLASDNWRFDPACNPGGPLFQCGIHRIDLLRRLLGEGKWHAGYVNRKVTQSATDDAYILIGQFGSVPVTFHSHYVACYRHAMEIYGTEGNLFITEYPVKLERKWTNLNEPFEPIEDITDTIPDVNSENESLIDFAAAVRERRQPIMNGREGLRALQLIFDAMAVSIEVDAPR